MKSYEIRKLKSLMAFHGITGRMVADKAGVSETFVSYVINRKRKSTRVRKIIDEMIRANGGEIPKA